MPVLTQLSKPTSSGFYTKICTNHTIVLALNYLVTEVVVLHGTREGSEILDTISGRPESDDVKV